MLDQNFSLIVHAANQLEEPEHTKNLYFANAEYARKFKRKLIVSEFESMKQLAVYKNKLAIPSQVIKGSKYFRSNYFEGIVKLTNDKFSSYTIGIEFYTNDIFYRVFQKKIQRLQESGILKHWYDNHTFFQNLINSRIGAFIPYNPERGEVGPLKFIELKAGFVIWLVAVFGSILVFIAEHVYYFISKKLTKSRRIHKKTTKIRIIKIKKIRRNYHQKLKMKGKKSILKIFFLKTYKNTKRRIFKNN